MNVPGRLSRGIDVRNFAPTEAERKNEQTLGGNRYRYRVPK